MFNEFSLIQHFFTRPTRHTILAVGDDCALIQATPKHYIVISTDTLVEDVHFHANTAPYNLGWKSLSVNLSDIAAMGAHPRWATLALTLPSRLAQNHEWLSQFSAGFFACADEFHVDLIGGDTTRGGLTITVQILGEVAIGQALRRKGAKVDDEIWVSGSLGKAGLALEKMKTIQGESFYHDCDKELILSLEKPQPRIALGLALRGLATSAIDISDGLLADLNHVLKASHVGAVLREEAIPCVTKASFCPPIWSRGDDYELCFTAHQSSHEKILQIAKKLDLPLTHIGIIRQEQGIGIIDLQGIESAIEKAYGYQHF